MEDNDKMSIKEAASITWYVLTTKDKLEFKYRFHAWYLVVSTFALLVSIVFMVIVVFN